MFSTSGDILNLVLSVCLVMLTFFLCWALYYLLSGIRTIHKLIVKIEGGVNKAEEVIDMAKDKLKNSATYLMLLVEVAKKAMEFIQEKREQKASAKKK